MFRIRVRTRIRSISSRVREILKTVSVTRPTQPQGTAPTKKRKIKPRHPFDIYEDQDEELRKLALEDQMRGGKGSMSAMVREAIDDYLAKVKA